MTHITRGAALRIVNAVISKAADNGQDFETVWLSGNFLNDHLAQSPVPVTPEQRNALREEVYRIIEDLQAFIVRHLLPDIVRQIHEATGVGDAIAIDEAHNIRIALARYFVLCLLLTAD